ncbi:MAG: hypothetical protein DRI65_16650 [Chloroflexota bacterium]|nr:MAG: hypothetical protein DRI65_16650 [Chloroflexota bacterium]
MPQTEYFTELALQAVMKGELPPFDSVFVGLSATSTAAGEVSATEYHRQQVQFADYASGMVSTNDLWWAPASSWGTINDVLICDSAQGGNVMLYDAVTGFDAGIGTKIRILAGNITIT